ncbi:hypothetical protein T492DRAFT_833436 [Pavlovales sp. CCMP2436]|nr:hypothetical protein T492DRAFT_833436 [Pavlovales sp. CCMP2436]
MVARRCVPAHLAIGVVSLGALLWLVITAANPSQLAAPFCRPPIYPSVANGSAPRVAKDVSTQLSLSDFFGCGTASCDGEPVGLSFSGGGWKAMAQHMGALRGLSELGLSLPPTLGANSGGSWTLLLLAHSPRFYNGVQGSTQPIAKVYADFMQAYATIGFEPFETPSNVCAKLSKILETVHALLVAGKMGHSWLAFTAEMLDAYEPGLSDKPATAASNPALAGSTLAFTTSLAPSAYLGKGGDERAQIVVNYTAALAPLPMVYVAKPDGSTQLVFPLLDQDDSVVLEGSRFHPLLGFLNEPRSMRPLVDVLPAIPMSVGAIGASSSAAAGLLGSDTMIEQVAQYLCLSDDRASVLADIWPKFNMDQYAVCTSGSSDTCEFTHGRMIDGAYTDNLGLVGTLASLQRSSLDARAYRLVASYANSCAGKVTMANCYRQASSLEQLFANNGNVSPSGYYYPGTPGSTYVSEANRGIIMLSPQIFAESLPPSWQAHGSSVFRTLTLELTTVDNPAYGIKGGSKVTLFVIHGNVGPSCPTSIPPGGDASAACETLASGMEQFVKGFGRETMIADYQAGDIVSPQP